MNDYLHALARGPLMSKTQRAALVPPRVSTGEPADEGEANRRRANTLAKRVADLERDKGRLATLAAAYAATTTRPAQSFALVDGDTLKDVTKRTVPGFKSMDAPGKAAARADHWLGLLQAAGATITDTDRVLTREAATGKGGDQ